MLVLTFCINSTRLVLTFCMLSRLSTEYNKADRECFLIYFDKQSEVHSNHEEDSRHTPRLMTSGRGLLAFVNSVGQGAVSATS